MVVVMGLMRFPVLAFKVLVLVGAKVAVLEYLLPVLSCVLLVKMETSPDENLASFWIFQYLFRNNFTSNAWGISVQWIELLLLRVVATISFVFPSILHSPPAKIPAATLLELPKWASTNP